MLDLVARMRALLRKDRLSALNGRPSLGTRVEQDKRTKLRKEADGKE